SLIRAGAHDVLPLPLTLDELETSVASLGDRLGAATKQGKTEHGKLVSVIKSVGGVGATAVLTQLAMRYAASEAAMGREVCIIDLDVQFGDVAFQLGLQ